MNEPNDEFEARLRRQLQAKASAIRVQPDERDLFARSDRRARRVRRAFVAVLAASLLIGPVGGYLVGRGGDGSSVAAIGEDDGSRSSSLGGDDDATVVYEGGPGDNWDLPHTKLFTRTTGDGLSLRVYSAAVAVPDDGNPQWDPPGWCTTVGLLRVGVVSDSVTEVVRGRRLKAPREGLAGSLQLAGVVEGEPSWVVLVQASGADVVRATFPSGITDEAEVHDGIAVLAARAPSTAVGGWGDLLRATVTLESRQGGQRVAEAIVPQLDGEQRSIEDCQEPPPSLPEPGEQPADVEAARAGVIKAYETVFNGQAGEEGLSYLQNSDELADVRDALADALAGGPFVEESKTATATVDELVFDRPDHAWVRWQLFTREAPSGPSRVGEAYLVDGRWRVANESWCAVVRLAGVECP
jgi:hypothetical protein